MVNRPVLEPDLGRFARRTIIATLVTLGLVAMSAAAYGYLRWSAYYLATGLWALVYLGLLLPIVKALVVDRRRLLGLGLLALKLAWVLVLFAGYIFVSRSGQRGMGLAAAVLAGATTPIVVLALRGIGMAMDMRQDAMKRNAEGKP